MRRVVCAMALVYLCPILVVAQAWTFARDGVDYVIDLPSSTWRVVSRVDVHEHVDFVYGNDASGGYLRISKLLVEKATTPVDLFRSEERYRLQTLRGYVVCGDRNGEPFHGHLDGGTFSYEYINAGMVMAGRIYYLQVDKTTFYALRFTVAQQGLQGLREQMDYIAKSFQRAN